jgi:hypothetical protein
MTESISPQKLEANRRNSLRSTGPRSGAGKAKSSRNALKDGLFAKFLISDGGAREDRDAYEQLLQELLAEYQPTSFIDRLHVRLLRDELWRLLNRVPAAEQGAIRKRADDLIAVERERRRQEFEDDKVMDPANLKRTSLGLQYLIDELDHFLTEVPQLDLTGTPRLPLEQVPESLAQDLAPLQQGLAVQALQDRQVFLLRELRRQRATLTRDLQSAQEREAIELEAQRGRLMLPSSKEMDRIYRAKTAAERRIDRLLIHLQPLKEARAAAERAAMRPRATIP